MSEEDPSQDPNKPKDTSGIKSSGLLTNPEDQLLKCFRALSASIFILFLFIAITSFLPERRLWGINHLAFYPVQVRLTALFLIMLSFIPGISRLLYRALSKSIDALKSKTIKGQSLAVAVSIIAVIILGVFHIKIHPLSDSAFLNELIKPAAESDTPTLVSVSDIITGEHIAPGTKLIYLMALNVGLAVAGANYASGLIGINILLGGILILSLLRFIRKITMKPPLSILLIYLAVFSGTLVLFAGYLSKYTPFLLAGALYILSSFRLLSGTGTIIGPSVFFALSLVVHTYGIFLAPSFVFLLIHQYRGKKRKILLRYVTPAIIVLTLAAVFAGSTVPKLKHFYLPFLGTGEREGIFSPGHIVDVFNIFLLILPAIPLLFSMPGVNRRLRQSAAGFSGTPPPGSGNAEEDNTDTSSDRLTLEAHFALLLFIPWLLFLFLLKPPFSIARNWDRFMPAALGILPAMIAGAKRFLSYSSLVSRQAIGSSPAANKDMMSTEASDGKKRRAKRKKIESVLQRGYASIVSPAVVISVIMAVSYLGINISPRRNADRFEKLLAFESNSAAQGYNLLTIYHSQEGRMIKAIEAAEKALSKSSEPEYYMNLSLLHLSALDTLSAIDLTKKCLREHPGFALGRKHLVTLLNSTSRYEDMIEVCKAGIIQEPSDPHYHYFLGKSYLYTGKLNEGVRELLECKKMNPPQEVLDNIDGLLGRIRRKK